MIDFKKGQAIAKSNSTQPSRVHLAGVSAKAKEHKDHESAEQPDISSVDNASVRRRFLDLSPNVRVVDQSPVERHVRDAGCFLEEVHLQRDGYQEP